MRTWLAEIRKSQNKSTYEVADDCGISQSFYFGIEAGTRGEKLPVQTAKKIAAALGFDWTRFYEEPGEATERRENELLADTERVG